ncbi:asparaginase [Stutzerimonas urumqiensis]|uniref:asparaginase n=1 Tax=Stutzerimonas urumqiensis TaxID=638269 RepID=UPI000EB4758E|nr:asparaginase [Stutzerimonas urumqiensis]
MSSSNTRLLVLYTGGTIGMQQGPSGLLPASGFEERLRTRQALETEALPDWHFRELSPPLDSADMTQANWLEMAAAVRRGVEDGGCDAVLVLHGTDTLAYSAAALSFLLLGLGVPVVLTGAMLPAGAEGSDAWPNLFGAMRAVQRGVPTGVHLYFNGALLHGARVTKLRSDAFDAFDCLPRRRNAAPAVPLPVALDHRAVRRPVPLAVLPLHPGVRAETLDALVDSGIRGLLLECYGSGTGPSGDVRLLDALRRAHARGVVLAAISQCPAGHIDFEVYATGSALRDAGLVSGGGMTREAALGKLFALLGAGLSQAEVEHWFVRDLCGEMAGP